MFLLTINILAPEWWRSKFTIVFLKLIKGINFLSTPVKWSKVNATNPRWWQDNFGLGYGLMASGNKPLPELMLTQIYFTIWHHWATSN